MNPNVKFGQAVKGANEGRKEGVLETRGFVKILDVWNVVTQLGFME